jgi:uncharacterized protein
MPKGGTPRIEVVDSLRGFAVFGILVSHCYYLFFLGQATKSSLADDITRIFVYLFVNNKFYTLFAFLFGLSFSLMLTRSNVSGPRFYRKYIWRLVLLFIIGLLHQLHWTDDILNIYALLGFVLLLINKLNDKAVIVLAVVLLLNLPSLIINSFEQPLSKEQKAVREQKEMADYNNFTTAMKTGSYGDTVRENIKAYPNNLDYYLHSGRFSFMLGFFCLGLVTGRRKLFQHFEEKKAVFRKAFFWTGIVAGLLSLLALVLYGTNTYTNPFWSSYFGILMKVQSNTMTLAYASGMALFFSLSKANWLASQFGYVGKMALTNYILHSLIGTLLLCGYGAGLLHYPIPMAMATLCSIPIFIFMLMVSRMWMHRYKYGPLEWVWRSAINLKFTPLRK